MKMKMAYVRDGCPENPGINLQAFRRDLSGRYPLVGKALLYRQKGLPTA